MRILKRQTKQERDVQLEALEAFANLGDRPQDWEVFRLMWPQMFPEGLDWIYLAGQEWYINDPDVRARTRTPLLWYRDCLRAFWARNDAHGINLKILLGFEMQAQRDATKLPDVQAEMGDVVRPYIVPGQPFKLEQQTIGGLPSGRPVVDGIRGSIDWEFACELQRAVYELMQQRWRAMVCPECGKFFLARRTRQTYCSKNCSHHAKNKRSLDWWKRAGSHKRDLRLRQAKARRSKG